MKKEEMKSIKKTHQLLYIVIILLIVNIMITVVTNGEKNTKPLYEDTFDTSQFKTITLENLKEYVDTDEYKVLVMGKPNCEYTNKMIPILEQAQDKFGYETLYVDLRNITEKDREVILSYDDETKFIEEYLGSTPFIIVFKNNQMIDTWVGYQDYLVFEKFLTSLGLEFEEN